MYICIFSPLQCKDNETAREFIQLGADVNAYIDTPYPPPIHMAAARGLTSLVHDLVLKGALVDHIYVYHTPLHIPVCDLSEPHRPSRIRA
jgi:ankyrin repeat protein